MFKNDILSGCWGITLIIFAAWELRSVGSQFEASLGKNLVRLHLNSNNKKLGVVVHMCHFSDGRKCKIGGWGYRPACAKSKTLYPK
jgi:hypothetical protein